MVSAAHVSRTLMTLEGAQPRKQASTPGRSRSDGEKRGVVRDIPRYLREKPTNPAVETVLEVPATEWGMFWNSPELVLPEAAEQNHKIM